MLLKNCTKGTFYLQFRNQGFKKKKKKINMEKHGIQGLPSLFFDNLQKTLKKLFSKHMKFYTMTHCITSSTTRKKP